jgi:manganese-dependent ADP-ribose/CDP-alcohol diphosphatase
MKIRMTPRKSHIGIRVAAIGLILFAGGCANVMAQNNAEYAFGVVADCQYCDVQGKGIRKYSLSKDKLSNCVANFNKMKLEYVIHLGDFIDRDFKSFDVLMPIYNELNVPKHHVLGNHDFSVEDSLKKDVSSKMGLPSKYYDFKVKGWRYVVLDGNDISFHAYPKNSEGVKKASEYYTQNMIKSPKWNGAIGDTQLSWLKHVLEKSQRNNEKVILFCHFPVYPENVHNLWNSEEVVELIEQYPCVKSYISGHNHEGGYGEKNGVHYLTLKGMVDTEKTSYAVIRVGGDSIKITGYGREENRNLLIRK